MARRIITNGPSKLDLMLARFDQEHHPTVTFQTTCFAGANPQSIEVAIVGDEDGIRPDTWRLIVRKKGDFCGEQQFGEFFIADYDTRTRGGRMMSMESELYRYWMHREKRRHGLQEERA